MQGENETGGLSPDEAAFFESRGETAPPAAAPEPAAEIEAPPPATGEEAEFEESEDRGKDHRVPVAVVRAERQKRQEAEKRLKESDERWARADERMRLMAEAQQGQQQPQQPEPPPDPEVDVFGATIHNTREVQDIRRWQAEQQQAAQQQQQLYHLNQAFMAKAQEFSAQSPDFEDAHRFVREKRAEALRIQGVPEHQIQGHLANDEMYVVAGAFQQGVNPAERLYALARSYGYAPKAADPQPDTGALIDAKADTVARAKSLSQAGGQATPRAVNAKALADMSDDDFDAFISKQGSKGFRRALNS